MATYLKKLRQNTMTATAHFAGEPIHFEYVPGKMDTDHSNRVQAAMDDGDLEAITTSLFEIMVSWDLMVETSELVEGGYYEGPDDDNPDRPHREVPDEDTIVVPMDFDAVQILQVPLPLFGVINQEIRDNTQNGGKSTKKGRRGN